MNGFRERRKRLPVVNITPLIDVLFILLIFFMVSSTFIEQPNIRLQLPRAAHADVTNIERLVVTISKDERIFLGEKPVSLAELSDLLIDAILKTDDRTLVIKADKNVRHGVVVRVIDIAKGAGFEKIVLPTEAGEGKPAGKSARP